MEGFNVPINYLSVLVGAVFSMVAGFIWYGPLFGKAWMKEMGLKEKDIDRDKQKGMSKSYALMMIGSLLTSYVLAHSFVFASNFMNVSGIPAGVAVGFWNWIGFIAPVTLGSVLWEGKSFRLWLLNSGYYLVTLVANGILFSVWR